MLHKNKSIEVSPRGRGLKVKEKKRGGWGGVTVGRTFTKRASINRVRAFIPVFRPLQTLSTHSSLKLGNILCLGELKTVDIKILRLTLSTFPELSHLYM